MIHELDEQRSYELLATTTVGRIGFVDDGLVQIHPVNFVVSGRELLLRTSPDGHLAALAREAAEVAFEVDYHDPIGGLGWSILMHGTLSPVPEDKAAGAAARVHPWAGEDRDLPLSFRIASITGRSVRRDARTGGV
ncbi:pyridoxamine 5'-phosphate oxidase family protein [Mycobacterium tuberculosis]|uniref:pyridoxamine 5'-phosphate oxidase family protein n=1 Tax=Mycobacterium tuberculosis TaxID=1773 RepID=UPI0005E1551B|nr:pyridoxamine 5'-phosphate oxidase family protein [Mycobacterium tuberculosis]CNK97439.1 pyridoxamine 5'-phosphate oxidase-like FMN-binding protein [Mycobacterium tuberculosis]